MGELVHPWHEAARTSVGFFWMALWAFAFGYLLSSAIQVLVTRRRMQRAMGADGLRAMSLATLFGFLSSSCSFAALAATRSLFAKGAGLAPALAFLLASTNLVIELGIVIGLFLSWQFVAGEYVGGLLLILFAWLCVRLTRPEAMLRRARERLRDDEQQEAVEDTDWRRVIASLRGWERIGRAYVMEWRMVWRDVLIGFTVAGVIAVFVPTSFFQALFVGSGGAAEPAFHEVLAQTLIGPAAAFCTFIGSMGNVPLAALLFGKGVSFAGVMAFLFSDLVVLPVLRINATYYGWRMALYILAVLLAGLVVASLALHYTLDLAGLLPSASDRVGATERDPFAFGYGFVLDLVFLLVSAVMVWLARRDRRRDEPDASHEHGRSAGDRLLSGLAALAGLWLLGGLVAPLVVG